jgi:gluconate 2-dehydrogenase gamma chain
VPKELYRISLAALEEYCKKMFAGKEFATLTIVQQDHILDGLENDKIKLKDGVGKAFFDRILADTIAGYFADPIYGGNRDMEGWKMIGFPGARYDYRDHVAKHNQPYPLPPVSILGRSGWAISN